MSALNVGAHLSLDRDPASTARWAAENGFRSMQIFASSPGAWKPPILNEERYRSIRDAFTAEGIAPLVIHSIYLINLASGDPVLWRRSIESLIATLEAGARMGASTVVTHIGSHAGRGFGEVAETVAAGLRDVIASSPPSIDLALENSAGAGALIGADIEELGVLIDLAGAPERLKIVLDTAHLCGAGWDFRTSGCTRQLVEVVRQQVGLERLAFIHANDSAQPCGSRRDRHTNIGEGHIGTEGFRHLLGQEELRAVPWILETPDLDKRVIDRATLEALAVNNLVAEAAHAG